MADLKTDKEVIDLLPEGERVNPRNIRDHVSNGHILLPDYQPHSPEPAPVLFAQGKRTIPTSGSWLYILQFGDRIKIGHSTNPRSRIGAHPYDRVLAIFPGTRREERFLHRRFVDFRVFGEGAMKEWYYVHPELLDFAAQMDEKTRRNNVSH